MQDARVFRQEAIAKLLRQAEGKPAKIVAGSETLLGTMHIDKGRLTFRSSRRLDIRRSPSTVELQFAAGDDGCAGLCPVLMRPGETLWVLDRPTLLKVSRLRDQARVETDAKLVVKHYGRPVSFDVEDLSEGGLAVTCDRPSAERIFRSGRELKALLKAPRGTLQVRLLVMSQRGAGGRCQVGMKFARPDSATKHALRGFIAQAKQAA